MDSQVGNNVVVPGKGQERDVQVAYWKEQTQSATLEAMMLDTQASEIDQIERPEILELLGPVANTRVVELGAGIGRFTAEFAKTAKQVSAYDFMENLTEANKANNGHLNNVKISQQDVTTMELAPDSCDVVFSNWLLMYLSDDEVGTFAQKTLSWVSPGGIIFFRESCFQQSGDKQRSTNPSHYRNPNLYFQIFDGVSTTDSEGNMYKFELVNARCVESYVKLKKNQNQITWKWKKVKTSPAEFSEFRHFLDGSQYTTNGILRYEQMFGAGYVSTGGVETTKDLLGRIKLNEGEKVLDVGCGIGGGDFYMAEKFGVSVLGVDLSVNMFMIALERSLSHNVNVSFEVADITTREYPRHAFDVVYSRDTILHIDDKPALLSRLYQVLKPGGRILITDYCRSDSTPSDHFAAYIKQRGYDLHPVEKYGRMLKDAGFTNVVSEDITHMFETSLRRELSTMEENRDNFVKEFSESDYFGLVNGWREKLERVAQGEQRWGLFTAEKAA